MLISIHRITLKEYKRRNRILLYLFWYNLLDKRCNLCKPNIPMLLRAEAMQRSFKIPTCKYNQIITLFCFSQIKSKPCVVISRHFYIMQLCTITTTFLQAQ